MACRSVGNVQSGAGIAEAIRIDDIIVNGGGSLIEMRMPIDVQINVVFMEEALKRGPAIGADRARGGEIPTPVAEDDNPRRHGPVDGCQIVGEPVDLLVVAAEWPSVLGAALVRADEAISKVSLRINMHEMNHPIVVRVPEVA